MCEPLGKVLGVSSLLHNYYKSHTGSEDDWNFGGARTTGPGIANVQDSYK